MPREVVVHVHRVPPQRDLELARGVSHAPRARAHDVERVSGAALKRAEHGAGRVVRRVGPHPARRRVAARLLAVARAHDHVVLAAGESGSAASELRQLRVRGPRQCHTLETADQHRVVEAQARARDAQRGAANRAELERPHAVDHARRRGRSRRPAQQGQRHDAHPACHALTTSASELTLKLCCCCERPRRDGARRTNGPAGQPRARPTPAASKQQAKPLRRRRPRCISRRSRPRPPAAPRRAWASSCGSATLACAAPGHQVAARHFSLSRLTRTRAWTELLPTRRPMLAVRPRRALMRAAPVLPVLPGSWQGARPAVRALSPLPLLLPRLAAAAFTGKEALQISALRYGKLKKDISFALRRGTIAQVTTHLALDGYAWPARARPLVRRG